MILLISFSIHYNTVSMSYKQNVLTNCARLKLAQAQQAKTPRINPKISFQLSTCMIEAWWSWHYIIFNIKLFWIVFSRPELKLVDAKRTLIESCQKRRRYDDVKTAISLSSCHHHHAQQRQHYSRPGWDCYDRPSKTAVPLCRNIVIGVGPLSAGCLYSIPGSDGQIAKRGFVLST